MAQDIVPIELGLTQGDMVTLWAPRWREDGEEWEAFLGHEEDLYLFPDSAQLAAFIRSDADHDLLDHPAWDVVPELTARELLPDADHQFDLVGVPELVAQEPDTWVLGELADIVSILRSLAAVCELDVVDEVLDASPGFSVLDQGTVQFSGRDGERLWTDLARVVVSRWDEVLDAVDGVVATPEVDAEAVARASAELPSEDEESSDEDAEVTVDASEPVTPKDPSVELAPAEEAGAGVEPDADPGELGFWREVGIDPIRIVTASGDWYTLRCYLGDEPVFLGAEGTIEVFPSTEALLAHIRSAGPTPDEGTTETPAVGGDLAEVSTWPEVLAKSSAGELVIEDVDGDNTYTLVGLDDELAEGPEGIDANQLELAVELLTDAADWAGDDAAAEALAPSTSLGWLVSFALRPDPTRLAPSPPYEKEQAAWRDLVAGFEERLHRNEG
ncbi:hypothetical protein [Actinoalloteichus spitiensis]|uniref:hypothetical protein n=1 Tax=Actinoalloteichus spitiensis TaxID=252394 RepID=UPI00037873CF|nr:hypothetical protein [Actinoalloteichus spitiensis]